MEFGLKALNNTGRIGGYLVVWGNSQQRDLQGEYFTPEAELGLDWYDKRPVLYHHGLDGTMKAAVIGTIDKLTPDTTGVWAEAQLDMRQKYVQTVLKLVEKGVLGWSSGSLPHLVETEAGMIKRWPIVEGSLTPTPAEPRQTGVGTIKSAYAQLGLDTARLLLDAVDVTAPDEPGDKPASDGLEGLCAKANITLEVEVDICDEDEEDELEPTDLPNQQTDIDEVKSNMDMKQVLLAFAQQLVAAGVTLTDQQIADAVAAVEQAMASDATASEQAPQLLQAGKFVDLGKLVQPFFEKALKPVIEATQKRNADIASASKAMAGSFIGAGGQSQVGGFRSEEAPAAKFNPLPTVSRSKYDNVSPEDMSYLHTILSGRKEGFRPDSDFMREIANKSLEQVKKNELHFGDGVQGAERATKAIKSMTQMAAIKADEQSYSTQAGFGDEWVPDLWSDQIWLRARLDNVIAPLFRIYEMPSNPFEVPVESSDPTVYFVPETKNETDMTLAASTNPTPDSKIASGKVQLTAQKLSLRVGFSTELVEDSIIPVLSQYRQQAQRAILNSVDYVFLNGDTQAGTTNVNFDGGTPTSTDRYLAFNGLRQILTANAANAVDMGGVNPTLAQIRVMRFTIDPAKISPEDIVYITDSGVYAKLLSLAEFITLDKAGPMATNMKGMIGLIDGSPVLRSAELAATATNGKVSSTGGNNVKGSMVAVNKNSYIAGYRRKINVNVEYLPYYDNYQLTANVRVAFARQDTDSAAVLYNILTT